MNDDTADLDRLFARLSGEGHPQAPDDHPTPEKLSAYQANELSPEEDGAIQEHLVQCALCTELLLDLQRFLEPPAEDLPQEGVTDFEAAAEWRELRGRMGTASKTAQKRQPALKTLYQIAAVLAILAVGVAVGSYHSRLQSQTAQEAIPVSLESEVGERSAPEPPKEINLPSGDTLVSLLLNVNMVPRSAPFLATVRRKQSNDIVLRQAIVYHPEGFALVVHSDLFQSGVYEVSIEGQKTAPAIRVGLYHFKIIR